MKPSAHPGAGRTQGGRSLESELPLSAAVCRGRGFLGQPHGHHLGLLGVQIFVGRGQPLALRGPPDGVDAHWTLRAISQEEMVIV